MKRIVCMLLVLCGAWLACNREDPVRERFVAPRLSGVDWGPCCSKPVIQRTCDAPTNREDALKLLVVAGGDCLVKTFGAVQKYAKEDLAAAYLIRGERNGDPVDFLRALETAKGFNRALAYEKLFLKKEAIAAWDEVVRSERGGWREEAKRRRRALMAPPVVEWNEKAVRDARDRATLTRYVQAYPTTAIRFFARFAPELRNRRLLADVISENGDPYARAIVDAMERDKPLDLELRYHTAQVEFRQGIDPRPILDGIAPIALKGDYRDLFSRVETFRATALEYQDSYFEAYRFYESALSFADKSPAAQAEAFARRSENYSTVGRPDLAFRDAHAALQRLPRMTTINAVHLAYASAATAAQKLGFPHTALHYRDAAVEWLTAQPTNRELPVALRARADLYIELGRDEAAQADLNEAVKQAEAIPDTDMRDRLRMRNHEVRGEMLLKKDSVAAEKSFTDAIALAESQDSTYRAVLHYKRGAARRKARMAGADDDIALALTILAGEAKGLREKNPRGEYEQLWSPYFSRFQSMYEEMIERRIAANDIRGAFVYAEQARAFEPLQLLLQSRSVPAGFEKIDSLEALNRQLDKIPDDTVILQYLVTRDRTYTWVLTRGRIELFPQRVSRKQIDEWVTEILTSVESLQNPPSRVMRAAYAALFREPLTVNKPRLVIVPDGSMYAIPFAALEPGRARYLIERGPIATAGSTSLYLYALARDREFHRERPRAFIVGNPKFDPRSGQRDLPFAAEEARQLGVLYGTEPLIGPDATILRFLQSAKSATIIHFAGHGVAVPRSPWLSMLLLTPYGNDSGLLTAEKLMKEVVLDHTRLVVLGACSSAGGQAMGPEGLSPLVRPLVAANVPGVVGTLWPVNDATAKQLLVSLHCHYRHGDDVAVALQKAQLEMLRNNRPAREWAAYQVVGYADSPYPHSSTLEDTKSERICSEDSVQRPDGLHPQ